MAATVTGASALRFAPAAAIEARAGSRRVALANRALSRAWERGWSSEPLLEPEVLIAGARASTGLRDLGDAGVWRERLALLCRALAEEADLSPLGRTMAYGQLTAALRDRLRAHALWARHPEIADVSLPAPVIVLGQMRSGTTRMQRLLACDPRLNWTRFYESWCPVPATGWPVDDRRMRAGAMLAGMRMLNPGFDAIHSSSLDGPDEEIGLHALSFHGSVFEAQWRVPSFARHCENADSSGVYREFRLMLQTLAWLRRDRTARPWVLKVPQLTQDLGTVLQLFPDARVVRVEREPVAVVASAASLVRHQMRVQSGAVDDGWIGREWLRKVALRRGRLEAALAERLDLPQVTVAFDAINRDWRAEMRRVYVMLRLELDTGLEARMAAYLARAGRGLERHRYSVEEFGLNATEVRAAA
ncbi:sulfotransferase [uncultured Sphingomonas sp.]|uniref:sulfotransferase family protein n=1 Tax=uncultured Sphingomonas sp. TaxID=158754 RepID=UPI0035CC4A88